MLPLRAYDATWSGSAHSPTYYSLNRVVGEFRGLRRARCCMLYLPIWLGPAPATSAPAHSWSLALPPHQARARSQVKSNRDRPVPLGLRTPSPTSGSPWKPMTRNPREAEEGPTSRRRRRGSEAAARCPRSRCRTGSCRQRARGPRIAARPPQRIRAARDISVSPFQASAYPGIRNHIGLNPAAVASRLLAASNMTFVDSL